MPSFKDLYNDKRFSGVSSQTKTDIISAIGIDVNEAKEDVAASKFTQQELKDALHYLLATEAKQNPNVQRLVVRENTHVSSLYVGNPFYFGNNDPFLWYWSGHPINHGGGFGGNINCGGGNGEGAALMCAAALVCSAGCCCVICTEPTINGPESRIVKTAKVTTSALTGAAVFVFLLVYLLKNEIWRSSLVDDNHWDVEGYQAFLVLVSAFSGLFSSGAVATVNNIWRCLPNQERQIPKPSAAVLEALKDLETVKTFLSRGWSRPNDDREQCDAFIREVVMTYINTIAFVPRVSIEMPASPSRLTTFGQPISSVSIPLPPAYNPYHYVPLAGDDADDANKKATQAPGGPKMIG